MRLSSRGNLTGEAMDFAFDILDRILSNRNQANQRCQYASQVASELVRLRDEHCGSDGLDVLGIERMIEDSVINAISRVDQRIQRRPQPTADVGTTSPRPSPRNLLDNPVSCRKRAEKIITWRSH
jgi:hypothetical protein